MLENVCIYIVGHLYERELIFFIYFSLAHNEVVVTGTGVWVIVILGSSVPIQKQSCDMFGINNRIDVYHANTNFTNYILQFPWIKFNNSLWITKLKLLYFIF